MKYQVVKEINLPRQQVIEKFDSVENLYKWQPELISFEHASGDPGQVGATSNMKYRMGKREIDMVETITVRELPERFAGTYEAGGVFNTMDNRFEEIGDNRTRWIAESEFTFRGFMKIMSWFMPKKAFCKQTEQFMDNFVTFAEGGTVAGKD